MTDNKKHMGPEDIFCSTKIRKDSVLAKSSDRGLMCLKVISWNLVLTNFSSKWSGLWGEYLLKSSNWNESLWGQEQFCLFGAPTICIKAREIAARQNMQLNIMPRKSQQN